MGSFINFCPTQRSNAWSRKGSSCANCCVFKLLTYLHWYDTMCDNSYNKVTYLINVFISLWAYNAEAKISPGRFQAPKKEQITKFLKNINFSSDSFERWCVKHQQNTHLPMQRLPFRQTLFLDSQTSPSNLMEQVNLSLIIKTTFLQHSLT